jgi:uridine kinase
VSAPEARPAISRSVIAIDGIDGSGKSRFAAALAATIEGAGSPVTALHVDDFRRPVAFARAQADAGAYADREARLYYDHYYDFAALDVALAELAHGDDDGTIVLLEGVFVLRASLPPGTPLFVLEVSPQVARWRILSRDLAKGRTAEEITRRIERRYFPAQARYRASFDPIARADVWVDNDDWSRPRVLRRVDGRFPPRVVPALDRLLQAG